MDRPESIAAPPTPTLLAALLCDTAAVDRRSGKESLLGICDPIMVSQCPAARVFSLYLRVTGAEGAYEFQVKVVHRRTAAVITRGRWHASVADPLKGSDYTVDLPPLQLPEAGRDEFHRYANTQYLGNVTLDACGFPTTGEKEAA